MFGPQATGAALIVILGFTAIKEIWEDWSRMKNDRRTNHQLVMAYEPHDFVKKSVGGWVETTWEKLRPGQLVEVKKGQPFPADLVLLASSEPAGLAYIETANLDGESNLKVRKALPTTAVAVTREAIVALLPRATLTCEHPNKNLYDFQGSLTNINRFGSGSTESPVALSATVHALDKSQFLQRTARLKNTDWIFAVVVYAGKETKFFQNSTKTKLKNSRTATLTNQVMMVQFGLLLVSVAICTYKARTGKEIAQFLDYLLGTDRDPEFLVIMVCFLLVFGGFVPISLYVTLGLIQLAQAGFISSDLQIYDEETDTPAAARSSALTSQLGEIAYIMADKTGTLTQNVMFFKNCSVGGVKYGSRKKKVFNPRLLVQDLRTNFRRNATAIEHFITACAICHSVVPERKDGEILFHASSPDEHALVVFARGAGFDFHTRTPTMVQFTERLNEGETRQRSFEMLQMFEFDSICKRMGVVVRTGEGSLRAYIKGADSSVLALISSECRSSASRLEVHLGNFAKRGLRTLCFAYKDLNEAEYTSWSERYAAMQALPQPASSRLERQHILESELLRDLQLIGASAIEDRLQEKVPTTIGRILSAGIRMWILTGDKLETAINIGFSCHLLSQNLTMMVLQANTAKETDSILRSWITQIGESRLAKGLRAALIIESKALDFVLANNGTRADFIRIALASHAVICCRCTPLQKASVTHLVRTHGHGSVLSIGDGGNDIAMIQAADVGVGLQGKEGNQAANSADFSIAQFRFLDRLLFVHGTLSLFRTNRCILHTIYKNYVDCGIMALFSASSGWSHGLYTDPLHVLAYNMWYTAFPPMAMGIFDRPLPLDILATFVTNYKRFQRSYNFSKYFKACALGLLHAAFVFFAVKQYHGDDGHAYSPAGYEHVLAVFGFTLSYGAVAAVTAKSALETQTWTLPTLSTMFLSVGLPWAVMLFQSYNTWFIGAQFSQVGLIVKFPSVHAFALMLLIVVAVSLPDLGAKALYRTFRTTPAMEQLAPVRLLEPLARVADILRIKTDIGRSGYAFAQDDGDVLSQADIMRSYNSTMPKQAGYDKTHDESEQHTSIAPPSSRSKYNDKTVDSESPSLRSALEKKRNNAADAIVGSLKTNRDDKSLVTPRSDKTDRSAPGDRMAELKRLLAKDSKVNTDDTQEDDDVSKPLKDKKSSTTDSKRK